MFFPSQIGTTRSVFQSGGIASHWHAALESTCDFSVVTSRMAFNRHLSASKHCHNVFILTDSLESGSYLVEITILVTFWQGWTGSDFVPFRKEVVMVRWGAGKELLSKYLTRFLPKRPEVRKLEVGFGFHQIFKKFSRFRWREAGSGSASIPNLKLIFSCSFCLYFHRLYYIIL